MLHTSTFWLYCYWLFILTCLFSIIYNNGKYIYIIMYMINVDFIFDVSDNLVNIGKDLTALNGLHNIAKGDPRSYDRAWKVYYQYRYSNV